MGILFHILTPDFVIKLSLCLVLVFVNENLPEVAWRVHCLACLDMSNMNLVHST